MNIRVNIQVLSILNYSSSWELPQMERDLNDQGVALKRNDAVMAHLGFENTVY